MKNLLLILAVLLFSKSVGQVNIDFEQSNAGQYTTGNAISGWTIQAANNTGSNGQCPLSEGNWSSSINEFYIMATPVLNVPILGTVPASPLGGTKVAQLQNQSPGVGITRITYNMNVNANNSLFQYAFSGTLDDGGHTCCDQPFARFELISCGGTVLGCFTNSITAAAASCPGTTTMMTASNGLSFIPWTIKSVDLSPFIGTCVSLRFTAGDCSAGSHHASFYFDCKVGPQYVQNGLTIVNNPNPVNFCSGSGVATIVGPPQGYNTYSWVPPNGSASISPAQATLSTLSLTNPVPGSVYTLNLSTSGNCLFIGTYTIAFSNVGIAGVGTNSTCINGTSGSATVQGIGSGSGYNYTWYNSTSSVVSTASVLSNVASGVYSAQVTALGAPGCGTAVTTVTVGVNQSNSIAVSKPFCGTSAFMIAPAGSNYQWYIGTNSVSAAQGGQAPSFTVTNASNNSVYHLTYTSAQGCVDSVKYTLFATTPGTMTVTTNTICVGGNNGTATISLPPSSNMPGSNYFIVNSVTPTASYNASVALSSGTSFTVNNLIGGGQYTIEAFDGSCKFNAPLSVATKSFNFNFSPATPTLCQGGNTQPVLLLSGGTSSDYTYTWSPAVFISNSIVASPVITPTLAAGSQSFITYTVIVTPTAMNCPLTKTYTVYYANPVTPSIVPVTPLCVNAGTMTINASPSPGFFSGQGISATGVLTPSSAVVGLNTVTYHHTLGGCLATAASTFIVNTLPVVTVSGSKTVCLGFATTLNATGANSYSWSIPATGSTAVVSPQGTAVVTVTGTSASGCSSSTFITLTTINMPTLQVNSAIVCSGNPATLVASGADTYSWSTGGKSNQIVVMPTVTTVYSVLGTNSVMCSVSQPVTVSVTPYPVLNVLGTFTVCNGDNTTFTASGADSYSWSTGATTPSVSMIGNGNKFVTVTGVKNPGSCSTSKTFIASSLPCTGIGENALEKPVGIYPNPNGGSFFISVKNAGELTIYNSIGQLVLTKELVAGKNHIAFSEVKDGTYFIRFSDGQGFYTDKIIIQKE